MTASGLPNNQNQVQAEIAQNLVQKVNAVFAEHGNHARLVNIHDSAVLYRNLFNLLLGSVCADHGFDYTVSLLRSIVETEQRFAKAKEPSPIILPFRNGEF